MKKIVFISVLALGLGLLATGCIPPPPRQQPKPPSLGGPPTPPGGPASGMVRIHHNFGNLEG